MEAEAFRYLQHVRSLFVLHVKQQGSERIKETRMTGNQAPTSHPVVEQPGAKLCKMGQDIKILQEFATPLFYHTSARYVSRNLTKVRLLVKQQYHLPRCTSSTIRTASWRLHATRAKGKWRLETRTDRGKQLLQEIANPSTDLVMSRNMRNQQWRRDGSL